MQNIAPLGLAEIAGLPNGSAQSFDREMCELGCTPAKTTKNLAYKSWCPPFRRIIGGPIKGSPPGGKTMNMYINISFTERFVHGWAAKPSPELIFVILALPCGREYMCASNVVRMRGFICFFPKVFAHQGGWRVCESI